jgi:hypothetical protein
VLSDSKPFREIDGEIGGETKASLHTVVVHDYTKQEKTFSSARLMVVEKVHV